MKTNKRRTSKDLFRARKSATITYIWLTGRPGSGKALEWGGGGRLCNRPCAEAGGGLTRRWATQKQGTLCDQFGAHIWLSLVGP